MRYYWTFAAMVFLLGTVLRTLANSAGPIFYDRLFGGDRYASLMQTIAEDFYGRLMLQASYYLFDAYTAQNPVVGSGISAMPSIHVAVAVINALFFSSINKWAGFVAWIYAAVIMFGSVHFGWHYAIDGYVSIVSCLLIWRVATKSNESYVQMAQT